MIPNTYHLPPITDHLRYHVLRDLFGEYVKMVGDTLSILCFLEMSRGAGAKLKARSETLQTKHVLECEKRAGFGVVDHDHFEAGLRGLRGGVLLEARPPMQST